MIGTDLRNLLNEQQKDNFAGKALVNSLLEKMAHQLDSDFTCPLHQRAQFVAFETATNKFGCHECIF